MKLFPYLAQKIYPLFPKEEGDLVFSVGLQHALNTRTETRNFDGNLNIKLVTFSEGVQIECFHEEIKVRAGKAEPGAVWYRLNAPELGYVEIAFLASQPIFNKMRPETGYSLFSGVDNRCLTVNSDMKFAHYWVIEQIKAWRKYCLLHTAVYIDEHNQCGESILLINPYDGPIVVGLRGEGKKSMRVRIPAKSARMIDLEPVATVGKFCTVMLSSNNRIIAYDVRHPYGRWQAFNSIDHLDTFSGIATRYNAPWSELPRQYARRGLRRLGLRYV